MAAAHRARKGNGQSSFREVVVRGWAEFRPVPCGHRALARLPFPDPGLLGSGLLQEAVLKTGCTRQSRPGQEGSVIGVISARQMPAG